MSSSGAIMARISSSDSTLGSRSETMTSLGRQPAPVNPQAQRGPSDPRLSQGVVASMMSTLNLGTWREEMRALALAAPLLLLLILSFGVPIVTLLSRAIYDPTIANTLPRTA